MNAEEPRNSDQPDHDRLPDYEIDLTGVVEQTESLMMVIGDAFVEAGDSGITPDWGARVMARYLANLQAEPNSALHHFAVTGRIDREALERELDNLRRKPAQVFDAEVIRHLGMYLIAQLATQPAQENPDPSHAAAELVRKHGPAMAAFLTLADVDVSTAESTFGQCYYGSFAALREIADEVADGLEVWRLIEEASLGHLVSPDPDLLLQLAKERWDIVNRKGIYYLFEK